MKAKPFIIVAVAALAVGAAVGYRSFVGAKAMKAMMSMVPAPSTVSTAIVSRGSWRGSITAVASLESFEGITVSAEVAGIVRRIAFVSGGRVTQGDLLLELDDSTEQAQLVGLKAAAKLAELNLKRAQDLMQRETNTQLDLDTAEATVSQANAVVAQVQALIGKKRIVAPFTGQLGIRQVSTGQYAAAGTAFVQLESAETVYADFGIPQQEISRLQPGMEILLSLDSYPGRVFKGKVEAINPRVVESTRSLKVRAAFPNPDGALRAGMFARVIAQVGEVNPYSVIPSASVVYSPYGDFVYVLSDDGKGGQVVRQQFLTLGEKRGDLIAVIKGLKEGEVIVTAGQMKLRNGASVQVNNHIPVDANENPKPVES